MLVFVALLAFTQASRLTDFFLAQPAINGAILVVAAVSAGLIIWEVVSLSRAVRWVDGTHLSGDAAPEETAGSDGAMPQLLFPLQSIMLGKSFRSGYSAENLSIVMDAIKARNDERRDLSQYLLQLLIFLGLFGTFWGLTLTVGDIGRAIGQLNEGSASGDTGDLFRQMIQSLQNPIGSMGIAFSSSLFGLAGTIIVGLWSSSRLGAWTLHRRSRKLALSACHSDHSAAGCRLDGGLQRRTSQQARASTAPAHGPDCRTDRSHPGADRRWHGTGEPWPTLESMERLDSSIAATATA